MSQSAKAIVVEQQDFPVFCPNPKMPIWSNHPRVYLDLSHSARARCPYCGTVYETADGQPHHGH